MLTKNLSASSELPEKADKHRPSNKTQTPDKAIKSSEEEFNSKVKIEMDNIALGLERITQMI